MVLDPLLQSRQRDWKELDGLGHVAAQIRSIYVDAGTYQAAQGWIDRLHQDGHNAHHRQRDMALFRLAFACAFKGLCHLVQCQVLWPTNFDHPIALTRIFQRDADKTSHVLHRYKIDWIVAAPKDDGLALIQNGLTDQLGQEVHERVRADDGEAQAAGAEVLLRAVLDAEELQWRIGTGPLYRNKNEVFRACNLGRIDQLAIACSFR